MSTSVLNLDVEALRMLTGFCHWIPAVNGRQAQFVQERYPGWEWNQIIPVLIRKNVLVINAKEPKYQLLSQGLYIAPEIESLTLWIRNGRTCFKLNKFHEMES
jgi:hypothetical protein